MDIEPREAAETPGPAPTLGDVSRRSFVRAAAATLGAPVLAACGGGGSTVALAPPTAGSGGTGSTGGGATGGTSGGSGGGTATGSDPVAPSTEPPRVPEAPRLPEVALPADLPVADGSLSLIVASPFGHSGLPFTAGLALRAGEVPQGRTVNTADGRLQFSVKNRWPDGSAKFGVLAGRLPVEPGQVRRWPLSVVGSTSAPGLSLTDLQRTRVTASIEAGAFGSATWAAEDWAQPWQEWVRGPEMSSWVYRKPVASLAGAPDPHLVAWLEVRLYVGGEVEVLPWVENGHLQVPNPGTRRALYRFSLGGTVRMEADIELRHHQRTVLLQGESVSHWLHHPLRMVVRQDAAHLQATEWVPTYRARVPSTSAAVQRLPRSYTPLQAGGFIYDGDNMASSGYQGPIGLLPEQDVLFLTSTATAAVTAVLRNGFSAGRYGIHYRDERTQRPLRFSQHPTLVMADGSGFKDNGTSTTNSRTPSPSGAQPPLWDVAHSPSVGYLAYLASGWHYFMEELQFATTANHLGNGDNPLLRAGPQGLVRPQLGAWQTRSCAWDWRARVQALAVTPDEDTTLRPELVASVEANIAWFHETYITRPSNPWGVIKPGESYGSDLRLFAPWQQDFVTAAFGHALALQLPISTTARTQLERFFAWKARSVVMRLGPSSGFWYVNAAPFTMAISPGAPPYDNGSGAWYETEAQVYAGTYTNPPAWLGRTEGQLAAEFLPGENATWGNLQPALAYAVRFNVAGAREAHDRMTAARNWPTLREAFNSRPVWSVAPPHVPEAAPINGGAGSSRGPAWWQGKPLNTWFEIPNTAGAGGAASDAYSGMALHEGTSEIIIAAAGGHNDSSDNRVVSLNLLADAPGWTLRSAPSTAVALDVSHYPDGRPTSRHLYQHIHVVESLNRVFLFGCREAFGNSLNFTAVDAFDLNTNRWDPAGTWAPMPEAGEFGVVRLRATGEVYSQRFRRWDPQTGRWSTAVTRTTGEPVRWPVAHDPQRRQLFSLQWGDGQGFAPQRVCASRLDLVSGVQTNVSFNPSDGLSRFEADRPAYAAMEYDLDHDRFLFYDGFRGAAGRIFVVTPRDTGPWDMGLLPLAAGSPLPPSTPDGGAGVNSRFRYVPALKGFVLLPRRAASLWFIRTA